MKICCSLSCPTKQLPSDRAECSSPKQAQKSFSSEKIAFFALCAGTNNNWAISFQLQILHLLKYECISAFVYGWKQRGWRLRTFQAVRKNNVPDDIYAKAFSFHLSSLPTFCLLRSFPKGIDLFRDARDAFLSLNANWKSFISPHVFCAAGATKDLCWCFLKQWRCKNVINSLIFMYAKGKALDEHFVHKFSSNLLPPSPDNRYPRWNHDYRW